MIKDYYSLTKPGIIYGNAITLIAGFVLASHGKVDYLLLFLVFVGLSLVIASGCVVNNYIDRDIDRLMERTKNARWYEVQFLLLLHVSTVQF